ncbi:hypothetical protein G9A89_023226 [Geosiphon pyriformis]|nr:hypothetical protein G9A89_023226 [Geosiphon pyriformis]
MELEKDKDKNQEFNYQNPIPENSEIQTSIVPTQKHQNNLNFIINNQQNLSSVIMIDPLLIAPIAKQQQLHLANKPQDFNVFKIEFLRYFSNNNSINCLANTFTTIKQGNTEAITTYLKSAVTHVRNFELVELEVNYTQAINLRNTSDNCKNSLKKDSRQQVDFSSASEKEYINTHNNQELKNNLYRNIKKKIFKETKVVTKTPNLTVLEFCHAIYTQNQSDLGLPEECCPAKSALTYYINTRINYHIGKEEEPHDTKLRLYRELSQYTTKEVAVIAATIVKIHQEIEQYANKNFSISTGNTRKHTNKTKKNLETNQESNQQKLGTPAQTPKKTVTQSIKKQRIYSPEDKSYHFSPENKIQIPLKAALSTLTPQTPRTPKFENHEEESESESEKETSKKTITRPVTGINSQSRNQETHDQEEEPDIREATFRNA